MILQRVDTTVQAHVTANLREGPVLEQLEYAVRRLYRGGVSCTKKQQEKEIDGESEVVVSLTMTIHMVDATANMKQLAEERIREMVDKVAKGQSEIEFTFEGETLPSEREEQEAEDEEFQETLGLQEGAEAEGAPLSEDSSFAEAEEMSPAERRALKRRLRGDESVAV